MLCFIVVYEYDADLSEHPTKLFLKFSEAMFARFPREELCCRVRELFKAL